MHWPINVNIKRLLDNPRMTGMRINSCLTSFLDTEKHSCVHSLQKPSSAQKLFVLPLTRTQETRLRFALEMVKAVSTWVDTDAQAALASPCSSASCTSYSRHWGGVWPPGGLHTTRSSSAADMETTSCWGGEGQVVKTQGGIQRPQQGGCHRPIDTDAQVFVFCLAQVLQHAAHVYTMILDIVVTLHRVLQTLIPIV